MAELLVDSYSETNRDAARVLRGGGATGAAQSFTAILGSLSSCKWYLKKYGNPTGNAIAYLYAHSGTYGTSSVPTGTALATSDSFDVSTLTTSYQLITLTFTGAQQYQLINGTYYCIAIVYSGGDGSNYINVGTDASSPTHSGNCSEYVSAWGAISGADAVFYVYIVLWTQTCAETITLSDNKTLTTNKKLSDDITTTDLITRIGNIITKILSDTVTLSDDKSFSIRKSLSEDISLDDSNFYTAYAGVISRLLADDISISDAVSVILYNIWFLTSERSTTWTTEKEDKKSWNED